MSASANATEASPSVVLVSSDGVEFPVNEEEANCSKMIRKMLENENFIEGKSRRVQLPTIPSNILEVIVKYMKYKVKYEGSNENVPEFDFDPKVIFEVLRAANYLDC
jgi:hypothetical protein